MAWTYDAGQFASTTASGTYPPTTLGQRYQVRFWIQDTISTRPLFSDDEVDWAVKQEANVYTAAASLCDILVAKAGGGVKSKRIGDLSIEYDVKFYITRGAMLRARGAGHQVPYAGGISEADKQIQQGDSDAVQPSIFRNLDNNPAAPAPQILPANPLSTV